MSRISPGRFSLVAVTAILCALAQTGCAGVGPAGDGDSYVDAMSREHSGDKPTASPVAVGPTDPVISRTVVYANVNGKDVRGYLSRPVVHEASLPGIVVIHEWWGLNDNIRNVTERLAAEGYLALAVDLYGGRSAGDRDEARELVSTVGRNPELAEDNLRQAVRFLSARTRAVGTIGWCFGGGWSLNTALMLPTEVDATVVYYGRLVTDPKLLGTLETPILGVFGELDRGIPPDTVREFERVLNELGKDADIHIYPGADHAFANPSGTRYQAAAAEDAWVRTLAFFRDLL